MLGTRNSRARLALGAAALVAALQASGYAQSAAASDETGPFRGYRGPEEASERVSGWLATGFAERLDLGTSFGGRPLFALQFGGKAPLPRQPRGPPRRQDRTMTTIIEARGLTKTFGTTRALDGGLCSVDF